MEENGIVIFSKPWDMTDEKTGERRQGISIEYLMCKDLKPVNNDDGSKGVRHCKQSLALDKLPKIKEVPGLYKLTFAMKVGGKGRPEIKLDDIDFIGPVK